MEFPNINPAGSQPPKKSKPEKMVEPKGKPIDKPIAKADIKPDIKLEVNAKTPVGDKADAKTKPSTRAETSHPPDSAFKKILPHLLSAILLIVVGGVAIALLKNTRQKKRAADPMQIRNR